MLQISRLTDYGLLILTQFARDPEDGMRSARDLADATDVPLPTVSKVLKTLARAGFLNSQRGAQGGYTLARPPGDINVAEIIAAFEGPIALTLCSEGPGKCDFEHQCNIRTPLVQVNEAIRHTLERLDLATITRPATAVPVTLGGRTGEPSPSTPQPPTYRTPPGSTPNSLRTGSR